MFSPSSLPVREKAGLPLQASKWLKCPILMDVDELQDLFVALGSFEIFLISGLIPQGEGQVSPEEFLTVYADYIEALKQGKQSTNPKIRSYFSSVFTMTPQALYCVPVGNQQQLIKMDRPVVQLQAHQFDYSTVDGKFRSMVWGPTSISWGIQFSYPQLYQDSHMQIHQTRKEGEFPNTALFHRLQRWVRQHSIATPFIVDQKRTNVPIRLGKKCLSWINQHPGLAAKGLRVGINNG